jgi:hypothetical protein
VIFFLLAAYALRNFEPLLKIAYATSFTAATTLYFYGWKASPSNPSFAIAMGNPVLVAKYVLCLIGSAAFKKDEALILGSALLAIYLAARWSRSKTGPDDLIAYFALISATMAALNRLAFGPQSALASRYSIYSLLFIAVVYCKLGELAQGKTAPFVSFVVLLLISSSYATFSWYSTQETRDHLLETIQALRLTPDGNFSSVSDRPKHVADSIVVLRRSSALGIYSPPLE